MKKLLCNKMTKNETKKIRLSFFLLFSLQIEIKNIGRYLIRRHHHHRRRCEQMLFSAFFFYASSFRLDAFFLLISYRPYTYIWCACECKERRRKNSFVYWWTIDRIVLKFERVVFFSLSLSYIYIHTSHLLWCWLWSFLFFFLF
jgi:hypothetical protein